MRRNSSRPLLLPSLCLGLAAGTLLGCSGDASAPKKPDDVEIPDDLPKAGDLTLNRNPDKALTCKDPRDIVIGRTPFVRLSTKEYANTLRDLLGPVSLKTKSAVEADSLRPGFAPDDSFAAGGSLVEGLSTDAAAVGALVSSELSKLGIERCPPANAAAESACLDSFMDSFVTRAYRRPVQDDERKAIRDLFMSGRQKGDFVAAIATVTEGILQTPQFLYRLEFGAEPQDGRAKLTGYEMASRLSYLLWKTMPDKDLMTAASKGDLDESKGINDQVKRMLKDDRSKGLATDFADAWLDLESRLQGVSAAAKSSTAFPSYTEDTSKALVDGFDRFLEDSLTGDKGGFKKLLSSRAGWVNKTTATIYGTTSSSSDLTRVELDENKRRGLLTQPALMAALAHKEKHAPVFRGVMVLDRILCQSPPPPPAGIMEPPPDKTVNRTTRERLVIEHEGQGGSCKSCHQIIDGVGFAFENYNAIGQWQDKEDGIAIDASAKISNSYDADGSFNGAVEMADKLAQSEQVAQCYVENFYRYALARGPTDEDGCNIARLTDQVLKSDADLQTLIEGLTSTPAFRFRSAL